MNSEVPVAPPVPIHSKRVLMPLVVLWFVVTLIGIYLLGTVFLRTNPDPETSAFAAKELDLIRPFVGGPIWVTFLGLALVCSGVFLRRLYRRMWQADRDSEASQLLSALRGGKASSKDFFLYLRAFETTGHLKVPLFMFDFQNLGLLQLHRGELEHLIGQALKKEGLLVALGHPGESLGAGRVSTSDELWKDDITLLATAAKGILLVPSSHAGTVWEIDHLQKQGLLSKTVFLMPPESRRFNWKAHWSESRHAMGELGSWLPEYNELGLLFTLGANGALRNAEPFSATSQRAVRKSLLKLLGPDEPKKGPQAAMARAERQERRRRVLYRFNMFVRLAAVVVIIPLTIYSALYAPAANRAAPTARDRLLSSTLYQQRIKGFSDEQASQLVAELTPKGVKRLDDQALVNYLSTYALMLSNADESTCEAMADGTVSVKKMTQLIENLGEPQRTNFVDTSYMAALAEIEQTKPPVNSSEEVDQTMEHFAATLTPTELRRLTSFVDAKSKRSPSELCYWQRKYFGAVASLPEPDRHILARYLVEQW
jgi:hypothetical protein